MEKKTYNAFRFPLPFQIPDAGINGVIDILRFISMALEGATRTWIAQSNLKNLAKGSGSLKLVSLFHTHTRARVVLLMY